MSLWERPDDRPADLQPGVQGPSSWIKSHLGKAAAQAGLRHKNEEFRLS